MAYLPISLVILTFNRCADIAERLEEFLPLVDSGKVELVIVDNLSTDGTVDFLHAAQLEHPNLVVAYNQDNKGVAGGRNTGFALAKRDIVVSMDDHSEMKLEDLDRIPALFERYPEAGILALRIVEKGTGILQNDYGDTITPLANHHGAAFAVRRHIVAELGGINPECNFGAEELDLAIRAHALGFKTLLVPEIEVLHPAAEGGSDSRRRYRRRVYNFVRTYYRYLPRGTARVHAVRFWISYALSWKNAFGFKGIWSLVQCAMDGRKAGLASRYPIPEETVRFYDDPATRPDLGNVPLMHKALGKHRSKKSRASED